MSNWAMSQAAAEIRALAQSMTTTVGELGHPATWSGDDADRFQRDWQELVHTRLANAANKLDGVDFHELIAGFDG
ncbi:MAG: hypothetical protein ABWY54_06115 [Glaciihabitans sp.]